MEGVIAIVLIFGTPVVAILCKHQRRMAELKLRMQQQSHQAASSDLAGMRQQLTDLRDLTTKYDLSFDQALQRIEARVSHLEQRVSALDRAGETSAHTV